MLLKSGPLVRDWELARQVVSSGTGGEGAPADPNLLDKLADLQTQSGCHLEN